MSDKDEFKSFSSIEKEEKREKRRKKANETKDTRKDISELIKNTLIMLAITLVAAGLLSVVNNVTKEPIAQMEIATREAANKKVFSNADSFSETMTGLVEAADTAETAYSGSDITDFIYAYDSEGEILGAVMQVTSHEGYGGDIVFAIGITNDNVINGISITSISETAGLGMNAEEVIVPQFKDRAAMIFEVVKTGSVMENQIDAISSATKTSKAITNGVNHAVEFFGLVTEGGVTVE